MLANHFVCDSDQRDCGLRHVLREEEKLRYALNDFDLSIMFPPDAKIEECRLPFLESYKGVFDKPLEVRHGELDFDPFAYDVACLGIDLAHKFQVSAR